jgi:hypothetical protein
MVRHVVCHISALGPTCLPLGLDCPSVRNLFSQIQIWLFAKCPLRFLFPQPAVLPLKLFSKMPYMFYK